MKSKYLLEIGVEEIPAQYVDDALKQLKNKFKELFDTENIDYEEINTYATPRRLTTIISGLEEYQKDVEIEVKGPSKKIAYNEDGSPSNALLGFMRGQGLTEGNITIEEFKGEEYIYGKKKNKGKKVEAILSSNIAKIIKSMSFPKSMKWGGKDLRFARPIRWIVSMFDDIVVDFELEGIKVSNETRGHRFLGKSNIQINHVDNYMDLLLQNCVIVDQNERKEIIEMKSDRLVREKGGKLVEDKALLDEVTNLVEYPTPIIGRIKDEYLSLPKDVIITPMKEHLRYFPVVDSKNRLLPYFITVRNGNEDYLDIVVKGNEKVLGARLEDAKFFFEDDISKPLEDYVDSLKSIVFQEKLGTLYEKTIRIQKLSDKIAKYIEVGEETEKNLQRASYLSKADLLTKMVTEFTELQGKMGMEYAKISGENEIVSLAIYEQYLPRFAKDELPSTTAGSILSIADKLDSISGLFAIGIHPTGSQDPFGLRRSALGIINIILEKKLHLSMMELIDFALYIYVEENGLAFDYNKVKDEIWNFFVGRIKNMFSNMGIRYDIIDSVINTEIDDICDMEERANKINKWLESEDISQILTVFNRVSTLAKKSDSIEVSRDLLSEYGLEVYNSYNDIEEKVEKSIGEKEYGKALDLLSSLKDPIDNFFENVMVMTEDEELKQNRLSLLKKIYDKMILVCDLSKIVNK